MYDMDIEPGHRDCISQVIHVDLAAYQPGSPHYEALIEAMQAAQRFSWPSQMTENL